MGLNPESIPIEWIQTFIDQLHAFAKKLPLDDEMRMAALVRAEYAMDLLEAWNETKK